MARRDDFDYGRVPLYVAAALAIGLFVFLSIVFVTSPMSSQSRTAGQRNAAASLQSVTTGQIQDVG